ncbi:MAG: head-tail adaptor protein [Chloroflexi bacterium HGW-Chloroflexi-5]|nr:MAG: head-tail adaptor protein [Chloroflexi bacterium HGW-Chloroflexi-5]
MTLRAGSLSQRITIQQPTVTYDAYNTEIQSWQTFATVWSLKKCQITREFYSAQKVNAEATDLFIIRFMQGITTKMRISYNGRIYNILGVDDQGGKREIIWIIAKAVS